MNPRASVAAPFPPFTGLDSASRLYSLQIEDAHELPAQLQFEAFWGQEALSTPYRFELLCLAAGAELPLKCLLGRQLRFDLRLADGSAHARSGYIIEARRLGADGALTRYQLSIVPWLSFLSRRSDCRVFQDQTVLGIVAQLFAPYAPRAAWQLAPGLERFMAEAPARSLCLQYRETDLAFLNRLLAEEGLGYCFVPAPEEGLPGPRPLHALLIFAHNDSLPEDPCSAPTPGRRGIRFHRADATETRDTVTALSATRVLQPAQSTTLSWDYASRRAIAVTLPCLPGSHPPNAPWLEDYDLPGPHAAATEASASRYLRLAREASEAANKVFTGTGSVRSFAAGHRFELTDSPLERDAWRHGQVRSAADAADAADARHFLLTTVEHLGLNNLPRPADNTARALAHALREARADASLLAPARSRGYADAFSAQRVHVPWRAPLREASGRRLHPRPRAPGAQSATVVGPQGETRPGAAGDIHTDALHRVHVQFHWQGAHPEAHPTHARAWLRVASRYAGPAQGAQFIPRIGQSVLVGFLDDDPDRPVVLGSLFDGIGEGAAAPTPGGARPATSAASFDGASDHHPRHQGNQAGLGHSPAWHGEARACGPMRNTAALSGFKSAEHNAPHAGYNQLVFDDSDGQQGIRLATTQAASQLNLGHLIHQADNYRGSHRGNGFELRTDAYGALRGGRGLMLGTGPRQAAINPRAAEPAGEARAAIALIRQAGQLSRALSAAAATHRSVPIAAAEGSQRAGQSLLNPALPPADALLESASGLVSANASATPATTVQGSVPHSADPLLTLTAQGSLGLVAGAAQQWLSGETLNWQSARHSNFALAGSLRVHTGQALGLLAGTHAPGALKLLAANGPLIAQAQADQLRLAARAPLTLSAITGHLHASAATRIHLAVAGGAAITLEDGHITLQCPGYFTVHASQHILTGPASVDAVLPEMPRSVCKACLLAARASGSPFAMR